MERFKTYWRTLSWAALVLVLSLRPKSPLSVPFEPFPHFDKLAHGLFYAVFMALWLFELGRGGRVGRWWNALAISAFGLAVEFAQHFWVEGRQGDFWDFVANSAGAFAVFALWRRRVGAQR